jgi:hypothetical protein
MALGSTVLGSQPAGAVDGDNIVIGTQNLGEAATWLHYDGTSSIGSSDIFTVYDSTGPLNDSNYPSAIAGWAAGGAAGVANGVYGFSEKSSGFGSIGLGLGDATTHGVFAASSAGYGLFASGGLAPIRIQPANTPGAPASGTHAVGELYVDSNGVFWGCSAGGTPGDWHSLVEQLHPLNPTIRVYDSRTEFGGPGPLQSGMSSVVIDLNESAGVPAEASAALINLTVVNTVENGWLIAYPAGGPIPGTSNINWYASNQIFANNATPSLNAGQLQISSNGPLTAKSDFVIDVFGYYR